MALAAGGTISAAVRRRVKEELGCAYCHACWASQVDHVIPVAQGGISVEGNLAHACLRCNAEKSGRTPRQWRDARLARGKCWPPPNCELVLPMLVASLAEADMPTVQAAVMAAYPPLMAALRAMHDRFYDEEPRPLHVDQAELLALAREHARETLGALF